MFYVQQQQQQHLTDSKLQSALDVDFIPKSFVWDTQPMSFYTYHMSSRGLESEKAGPRCAIQRLAVTNISFILDTL